MKKSFKSFIIEKDFDGSRVDRFLKKKFPDVPQSLFEKNLRKKNITVNNKKVKNLLKLKINDIVDVYTELKTKKATPFELSDQALAKLSQLSESEKGKYFRVYVTGGGCSGFQYGFKFDEFDSDEDSLLDFENGIKVLLDQLSYPYIIGSLIDYKEDLMGAKFTVENPNAASTCGCGSSFSI